jgi:hypothetical protein
MSCFDVVRQELSHPVVQAVLGEIALVETPDTIFEVVAVPRAIIVLPTEVDHVIPVAERPEVMEGNAVGNPGLQTALGNGGGEANEMVDVNDIGPHLIQQFAVEVEQTLSPVEFLELFKSDDVQIQDLDALAGTKPLNIEVPFLRIVMLCQDGDLVAPFLLGPNQAVHVSSGAPGFFVAGRKLMDNMQNVHRVSKRFLLSGKS